MIAHALLGLAGRAITIGGAAVLAGLAFTATPAHATASGSFTKSCTVIDDENYVVNASCKKKNGKTNGTSLAYRICQGDIWNDNGVLKCTPSGSFKNSCNGISWNDSYLMASCRKKNGHYLTNSGFSYGTCLTSSQDIANIDGSLMCQ